MYLAYFLLSGASIHGSSVGATNSISTRERSESYPGRRSKAKSHSSFVHSIVPGTRTLFTYFGVMIVLLRSSASQTSPYHWNIPSR